MDARYPIHVCVLLFAVLICGSAAAQDDTPERLAARIDYTDPDDAAAERDRRFTQAQQLADKDQWPDAIRAAQSALELERKHHPALETGSACSILQYLAVWQQLAGDYPAAVQTIQQLLTTSTRTSGPDHWLTKTTRVDLADCQRDAARGPTAYQRLAEANRFEVHALRLQAAGKFDEALQNATKCREIREQVAGLDDACGSECLNSIGFALLGLGRHKEALPCLERSAQIRLRLFGRENPNTLATLQGLSIVHMVLQDYDRARDALENVLAGSRAIYGPDNPATWQAALELATFHIHRGNADKAEPIMTDLLAEQIAAHGADNFHVARTRLRIGQLYARTGNSKAARYLEDAAATLLAVGAAETTDMATTLATLGLLDYDQARYDSAEQHCKNALAIFDRLGSMNDARAIDTLACLARIHKSQGGRGQAERELREALDRYVQLYGEQHVKTAGVLTELGALYQLLNKMSRAEDCLRRALRINQDLLGEGHPDTITTMVTLGSLDVFANRLDTAQQQFENALALAQKHLGPEHETTHSVLLMLGNLYFVRRDFDEAERTLRALWLSRKAKFPDQTYENSIVLQSLIEALVRLERYAQAIELGEEALGACADHLSEFESGWTSPLQSTAIAYFAMDRPDEARQNVRRAIDITVRLQDAASIAQSEQQQIKMSAQQRSAVNLYLSLPDNCVPAEDAWSVVLLRKGAVHARQVRNRRHLGPDQRTLAEELQKLATQLATLSLKVPQPAGHDAWLAEIAQLKDRKAALEADLAASIRDSTGRDGLIAVSPDELRAALPERTALVDLFVHSHTSFDRSAGQPRLQRSTRLSAFIARRDRPVVRIDLGELQPIEDLVESWRTTGRYAVDGAADKSAAALRQTLWEPIAPHLKDCETILFSPDGKLARLPLGALPGEAPGSFLLEQFAIAVLPVPQLLPDLLADPAGKRSTGDGILLIGDIDFDASPDGPRKSETAPPASGTGLATFARLKSTGPEIHRLAELYRRQFPDATLHLFERADATEAAFRREAPTHSTVVIATHGFYAPEGISSALSAQNHDPDLGGSDGKDEYCETLSGLALAGANRGAIEGDDGILTATEVSALDLRGLDLVVLSGCETALGAVSDGEGALGLQRAFLKAGARSTVSSLWTVPDRRTSQLMQRFHDNRWKQGMSKLDALCEAQLWMLRTGGKDPSPDDPPAEPPKRLAPYYWAAFILSGDWR